MDLLYRFEARFSELIPLGMMADGIRVDAHFEGLVVAGRFAGATVRGIDYLRFRSDGVGIVEVREVFTRNGSSIEVHALGYMLRPPGFSLPPMKTMLSPDFEWPAIELPVHGSATFRTAAREWEDLNTAVGLFNGIANPGARAIVVEAETFVPRAIASAAQKRSIESPALA